jgi:hypothetical protein
MKMDYENYESDYISKGTPNKGLLIRQPNAEEALFGNVIDCAEISTDSQLAQINIKNVWIDGVRPKWV